MHDSLLKRQIFDCKFPLRRRNFSETDFLVKISLQLIVKCMWKSRFEFRTISLSITWDFIEHAIWIVDHPSRFNCVMFCVLIKRNSIRSFVFHLKRLIIQMISYFLWNVLSHRKIVMRLEPPWNHRIRGFCIACRKATTILHQKMVSQIVQLNLIYIGAVFPVMTFSTILSWTGIKTVIGAQKSERHSIRNAITLWPSVPTELMKIKKKRERQRERREEETACR